MMATTVSLLFVILALIALGLFAMLIICTVSLVSINKKLGKLVDMQGKANMPSPAYTSAPYYENVPRNYH